VDLRGKHAVLIGLGARTHVALARYLINEGARVTISDRKPAEELQREIALLGDLPVRLSLGGHHPEDILGADIIFVSPGVPRSLPILAEARARGIPISSEIELFFARCPARLIGITGSSGKTTTTSLVGAMLATAGRRTFVGGNIGRPLITDLPTITPDDWVVLELSSFQLEPLVQSPHIGVVLNITPNHLDRHGTFENYVAAKTNIIRHQRPDDWAILGYDDPTARRLTALAPGRVAFFSLIEPVAQGAFLAGSTLVRRWEGREEVICSRSALRLRGEHNVANVLAACAAATAAGVPVAALRAVATTFPGVEHRLELVRELDGVRYYNDSIATSPERAVAALKAFDEPVVLIAGGRSKHLPLDDLAAWICRKCRAVVLLGEMADDLAAAIAAAGGGLPLVHAADMATAVRAARQLAQPGDVVLLSPGGTSFDLFRDFEDRGHQFKAQVLALPEGPCA
jgi:UDP-N-acetylmuramoylalanine--D-glutamate ligase